ncbi:ABC-type polar amino acid transport system ATPase subunit [Mycoplana sp. BE70]|nr:ABC-type polar amino acid transport system ATPase subunit [Mycoplana sp. BE70]
MAFIEIDGLRKNYHLHEVLKGINLQVDRHQVVTLIGASGSGKSTLLRCLNALESIDGGTIRVAGDVVSGPGVDLNRLRRKVGMVFQSFNLFPHMTVEENIAIGPVKLLTKAVARH